MSGECVWIAQRCRAKMSAIAGFNYTSLTSDRELRLGRGFVFCWSFVVVGEVFFDLVDELLLGDCGDRLPHIWE